jgi:hypothetical protein
MKGKDVFDCDKGHFAQPVAVVRCPVKPDITAS